jgi:hypothetical protein
MKTNFDYKEVPRGYTHCFNAQCPRAEECLRFLVTRHIDSETASFQIINPAYIAEQQECQFFKPDSLISFALGMTHLFDNLPHAKVNKIKGIIRGYFGRTCFYRVGRKERLIKPEEQDFIRQTFIREGITEPPAFDKYIEQYAWF